MQNVIDVNTIANHSFSLWFSNLTPSMFNSRYSLTCLGSSRVGEKQWAWWLVCELNNFSVTDIALVWCTTYFALRVCVCVHARVCVVRLWNCVAFAIHYNFKIFINSQIWIQLQFTITTLINMYSRL